ncbi:MAG: hypothetical protein HQL75_12740 [Magnetococcales bacterium]|nr:hypothetical protein [Magnetococcales bacterium]
MSDVGTNTCWHCLVGETLKTLLEPVDIEVRSEVPVVSAPPKADLILIQRKSGGWTKKQRHLLADGLWDLDADHILAELKITESLNENSLSKLSVYDTLYLEAAGLERHQLASVAISAVTPRDEFIERFAFKPVGPDGVFQSQPHWGGTLRLILLNELADTPRNAPLKCFASRQEERKKAFETIKKAGLFQISLAFGRVITGLRRLLMKGSSTSYEMENATPEHIIQVGRDWLEFMVECTPDEELFAIPKLKHYLDEFKHQSELKAELEEIQKGRRAEAVKTLQRLLQKKFGPDLASRFEQHRHSASLEELETWTDRILDAQSIDGIFQS